MNKQKPAAEVRLGSIKAAIWENPVADGVRHNVTFSRIYKDENEWKTSESFGRDDLLLLAKVADEAHSWIHDHQRGGEKRNNGSASEPVDPPAMAETASAMTRPALPERGPQLLTARRR